jgi:hypothetical protein
MVDTVVKTVIVEIYQTGVNFISIKVILAFVLGNIIFDAKICSLMFNINTFIWALCS